MHFILICHESYFNTLNLKIVIIDTCLNVKCPSLICSFIQSINKHIFSPYCE
jgi:hypothetical protein